MTYLSHPTYIESIDSIINLQSHEFKYIFGNNYMSYVLEGKSLHEAKPSTIYPNM